MNIVNAIINLVNHPVTYLVHDYRGRNRANNAGDALEEYVKDLFSGTFDFMCIINYTKWETLENNRELTALASCCDSLRIQNVRIKNPDNPAQLQGAKLITFGI